MVKWDPEEGQRLLYLNQLCYPMALGSIRGNCLQLLNYLKALGALAVLSRSFCLCSMLRSLATAVPDKLVNIEEFHPARRGLKLNPQSPPFHYFVKFDARGNIFRVYERHHPIRPGS